ncbi:hypothetical protein [Paractinoplanes deccanensis]|uniref:hypothetical protein n=1 Tax=Paractinoplanes deccanensis TaxID=113561 RepID=UPI0019448DF3|nr:hypothetical protein [Actinoplanes deccanensis]
MTAFLVVRAGDEAVTVVSIPPHDTAARGAGSLGRRPRQRRHRGIGRAVTEAAAKVAAALG